MCIYNFLQGRKQLYHFLIFSMMINLSLVHLHPQIFLSVRNNIFQITIKEENDLVIIFQQNKERVFLMRLLWFKEMKKG